MKRIFSIVIPVYKNELNLPVTIPYVLEQIPILFPEYQVELILVNDGSPDHSWTIMKEYQAKDPETIRIIDLIHNFGQGNAVLCGIGAARGNAIGTISADLQDPLDLFPEMLVELNKGYDMVCGVREKREEKGLNVLFSKTAHFLIKHLIAQDYPRGGFDFYVVSRKMADRMLSLRERNGSGQLQMLWLSGATKLIPYAREARELGKSSWTFSKKLKYFIDTFVSNSYMPIRVMSVIGLISSGLAFLASIYVFITSLIAESKAPGWSSTILLIMFFSGLILTSLGVIGEYLWRIFDEVRGRPLYIVKEVIDDAGKDSAEQKIGEGPYVGGTSL